MFRAQMKRNSSCNDSCSALIQIQQMRLRRVRCAIFDNSHIQCLQFACVRQREKDANFWRTFPQRHGAHLFSGGKAPDAS